MFSRTGSIVTLPEERGAYAHGRQEGVSGSRLAPVDEYAVFGAQREFVCSRAILTANYYVSDGSTHGPESWW